MNNKKIWDNLMDYIPYPYSMEDADEYIDSTRNEDPTTTFAITNDSNELLGVIRLSRQNDVYRLTAELGYWIGEPYWGQGAATRAIELITRYGFETMELERIFAGVFDFNKGSIRALEKNGYQLEAIMRNAAVKNGKILDEHILAKLKTE